MQILKPHLSEKSFALAKDLNVYVFKLAPSLNCAQIKQGGKKARTIRLGSRRPAQRSGRRTDFKKAYVVLKEGDSIPVFTDYTEDKK